MANFISKRNTAPANTDGPYEDPYPGCCQEFTTFGRCHYAGTISHGGDKFYCREHFFRSSKRGKFFDSDEVIIRSHHDHPHPDYSLDARRKAYKDKTNREMMDWLRVQSEKPPKASEVILKLVK